MFFVGNPLEAWNGNFVEEAIGACRSVLRFEKLGKLGEGTYGVVCMLFLLLSLFATISDPLTSRSSARYKNWRDSGTKESAHGARERRLTHNYTTR